MNTYDPSDERLNAWIDGELTADEAIRRLVTFAAAGMLAPPPPRPAP